MITVACSCLCKKNYIKLSGYVWSEFSHLLRQSETGNLKESEPFIEEK